MKVEAQFRLKNQAKNIILPLHMTYYKESHLTRLRLPGNLLLVTSNFEIDLNAFGISLPDALRPAMHKSIVITANFVGSDRLPTGADGIPDGIKPKDPVPQSSPRK